MRFVCTSALENSEHTKSHREIKSGRDLTRCCGTKKEECGRERDRKEKNSEAQKNPEKCVCKIFHWLIIIVAHVAVQTHSGCKFNKNRMFLLFQVSRDAFGEFTQTNSDRKIVPQSNSSNAF